MQPTAPEVGTEPAARSRITEIDALRGIAALMVVLFHYSNTYDRIFGHGDQFWLSFGVGRQGVELFFLISGFVIFMTLDRVRGSGDFVLARVSRLYPTYWVSVLLTATVIALAALPGLNVAPLQVLVNLTMLQTFVGVGHVDGVYWTMAIELAFYGWLLVAYQLRLTRRIESTLAIWLAVLLVALVLLIVIDPGLSNGLVTALLLEYGNLFAAGMLFFRMRVSPSRMTLWLLAATYLPEAVLRPESALIVAGWYAVFGLLIAGRLGFLNRRPLLFLGSISYPLYLLHQSIGWVLIDQLYAWGVEDTLLLVLIPLAVSVLLATAVHHAVELPAQHAIRARFRRTASTEAIPAVSSADAPPSAVTGEPAYNARHALDSARPSEEARPWRQMRPASPAPATTSRT